MPYRRCGNRGLRLPAISLGLWHNFGGVDAFENMRAMLRRAFDLGITHFDLANNYVVPPSPPLFRRLIRLAGVPLAAPSANPFGSVSPTTAGHVRADLGPRVLHILDSSQ